MEQLDFEFNYEDALKAGSLKEFHQFALGKVYTRRNFKWFQQPVIPNGPYGATLRNLHVRQSVKMPKAGKIYNLKFRVVFLTYNSVTIDILELEKVL